MCPGAAAEGHEEQDPAAAGVGDRQDPDQWHWQGEVRVAGAARFQEGVVIERVGRPSNSGCFGSDNKKASPRAACQDPAPCIHESLGKPSPIDPRRSVHRGFPRPALYPLGALSESVTPSPLRPSGAQFESRSIPQKVAETTSQSVNVEVPGSQTSEPGPSQSVTVQYI